MAALTHEQVVEVVGDIGDDRIVEIIATGAALDELVEAFAWLSEDDYLGATLERDRSGTVGRLIDILTADEPEGDER